MNTMTPEERELILEEIHGVASSAVAEESAEFRRQNLIKLNEELVRIRRKSAYDLALVLSPKYANDPAFQLMFLRAERFDIRNAAMRMVRYFEHKLHLWGEGNLAKKLTIEDLSDEDVQTLKSGHFRMIDADMAGRPIAFLPVGKLDFSSSSDPSVVDHQLRAQWYLLMTSLKSETVQQHGIVKVLWGFPLDDSAGADSDPPLRHAGSTAPSSRGQTTSPSGAAAQSREKDIENDGELPVNESQSVTRADGRGLYSKKKKAASQPHEVGGAQFFRRSWEIFQSIPVRIVAIHYCADEAPQQEELNRFLPPSNKGQVGGSSSSGAGSFEHRLRSHIGPAKGCLEQLGSFGIPSALLSHTCNIDFRTSIEEEPSLNSRFRVGAATSDDSRGITSTGGRLAKQPVDDNQHQDAKEIVGLPDASDVLLGRGRPFQEFSGNRLMNRLIKEELKRCEAENLRVESASTVKRVWEALKSRGTRFLKRSELNPDEWKEVEESVGREKVYFAVRIQVRKMQRPQSGSHEESSRSLAGGSISPSSEVDADHVDAIDTR